MPLPPLNASSNPKGERGPPEAALKRVEAKAIIENQDFYTSNIKHKLVYYESFDRGVSVFDANKHGISVYDLILMTCTCYEHLNVHMI